MVKIFGEYQTMVSAQILTAVRSAGFLLCLLAFNSYAAMYKWVDEDGVTHYSQQPPPAGIEAETIKPPRDVDTEGAERSLRERQQLLDELSGERNEKAEEREQAQQSEREKKEACRNARQRLQSFQNPRINFVDKDGTRRRATEEERQRELKKARDYIRENCN